jgi:hypothetical protein
MPDLTDAQAAAFFRRSYSAVDGLWFRMVEDRFGLEAAFELDEAVWGVMPKIQARQLKAALGQEQGLAALVACFGNKLAAEGYRFEAQAAPDGARVDLVVRECPWHNAMVKAGRAELSGRVGERICRREYAVWAAEFGPGLRFDLPALLCQGAAMCVLRFEQRARDGAQP